MEQLTDALWSMFAQTHNVVRGLWRLANAGRVRPLAAQLLIAGLLSLSWCGMARGSEFAKESDIAYAQNEEPANKLDAFRHSKPGLRPAFIYVHGGGFVSGDKSACPDYLLESAWEHGFSVFSVNYRLAPKHPYPAAIDDVAAAVKFIRRQAATWNVDVDRLVITGESAGGLISALVGATLQGDEQLAAVIPVCGEVDLELRVSEDPCCVDMRAIPRPPGGCISGGLGAFLGFASVETDSQRQTLRDASAITYVRPKMPPYLLVHGTRDFGIPYEQSVSLQQAMLKAGADCTLLPIVGGGHVNWSRKTWDESMEFAMRWLHQRLDRTEHP